ncbi:MAG: hypothetical protein ACTIKA_05485 [Psychroflexus halocasei]|uniref:hypothetical protein n=1 Tax=Psychroflexus sp. S27 TaxID=1982757 RepID=UPI00128FF60C|nr:hypothetical protein [Psychroflexus sp. S27]
MRKIVFLILINFLLMLEASAQSMNLEFQKDFLLEAEKFFGVDDFDAIYFSADRVFYKQSKQKQLSFQDFQLGEITHVDLLNPLRISLFYKNANTVVILDNHLNEITRLDFSSLENPISAEFASLSRKNQLWVVDALSGNLLSIDINSLKVISESLPLEAPYQSFASDYNNFVYTGSKQLYIYSTYTIFIKSFHVDSAKEIKLNQGQLLYKTNEDLILLHLKTEDEKKLKLPDILIQDFHLNGENLYLYDGKKVYFFKITV